MKSLKVSKGDLKNELLHDARSKIAQLYTRS